MEIKKDYSMKKSLRDLNANKATTGKPFTTTPHLSHIMRESMIIKSTSAARAAGLRQIKTQQEKPLPSLPQIQAQPQSAPHQAAKSGSGRGRLADRTMRKAKIVLEEELDVQFIVPEPGIADVKTLISSRSGSKREGSSYPPSAWKPMSHHNRDASSRKPLPRDAGRHNGHNARTVSKPTPHVVSSDHARNDSVHETSHSEQHPEKESFWARQYPARDEKKILQNMASTDLTLDNRPQTAGARLVTKLSSWSRNIKEARGRQRRPSTADDAPTANSGHGSHWSPFRVAVEKLATLSRPPSREEWRPVISRPIDNGQVFAADIIAQQEQMPRTYSSWLAAQLAETEKFIPLEKPRDPDELHTRDTQASMESRMTQMGDFIEQYSWLKQPVPKSSLISKLAHSRPSISRSQTHGMIESSPLDFACCGEWVDPEPDYDPFKELDEVLTQPEFTSGAESPVVGLGIKLSHRVSNETGRTVIDCPECHKPDDLHGEVCSNCGWERTDSRDSGNSPAIEHIGLIESDIPEVVPKRLSIYSQHPAIYSVSNSSPSKSGTNGSHSSKRSESNQIEVDLSSLAGTAYHGVEEYLEPSSSAISSEYSVHPESGIYDDPGNPFADQRAVDAYREAMNRWHPPNAQVAPLSSSVSSFEQHRKRILALRALQQQFQTNMSASSPYYGGHVTPTPTQRASNPNRESVYTLYGHADDEVERESSTLHDMDRETWMTLDSSYQPRSKSRGMPSTSHLSQETHATTIGGIVSKENSRSFASRAAASKNPTGGQDSRSASDQRWPYSPEGIEYSAEYQKPDSYMATTHASIGVRFAGQDKTGRVEASVAVASGQGATLKSKHMQTGEAVCGSALYSFYDDLFTSSSEEDVRLRPGVKRSNTLKSPRQ